MPIENLTFTHNLLKQHTVDTLEGHVVVVLEGIGGAGEKYRFEIQPGHEPPKPPWLRTLAFWRNAPNYFAYAVTTAPSLQADFGADVHMDDHLHDFAMTIHVTYTVAEPRLLVIRRNDDPLKIVRDEIVRLAQKYVASSSWDDVANRFRRVELEAVNQVIGEVRPLATTCGLRVQDLALTPRIQAEHVPGAVAAVQHVAKLDEIRKADEIERLQEELKLLRDEAQTELAARRRTAQVLDAAAEALSTALKNIGDSIQHPAQIRDALANVTLLLQDLKNGRTNRIGATAAFRNGPSQIDGGPQSRLAPVLEDIVSVTEELECLPSATRQLQSAMLHLVAELLPEEMPAAEAVEERTATIIELAAKAKLSGAHSSFFEGFVNSKHLRERLQ
jgi:hypothetical protein